MLLALKIGIFAGFLIMMRVETEYPWILECCLDKKKAICRHHLELWGIVMDNFCTTFQIYREKNWQIDFK